MIPLLDRLATATRILIAGCGGGFDVFAGIPIAQSLISQGKEIVFANYSFTNLWMCGGERIAETTWRVDRRSNELPYFPERWLAEWFCRRGQEFPIYAFGKSGVKPLATAYRTLVQQHGIDLILLVDGGTDSLLFGDEPGLGTVVEDATSIVAGHKAVPDGRAILAAIGFGIDHFHGVSHYAFLENTARLIREGGFLGTFSVALPSAEAQAFIDLVDYANQRQPQHRSIVCNSIASAFKGEFGDYHATERTSGSELFINPLMSQYWTFNLGNVVANMAYSADLAETESVEEVRRTIERSRAVLDIRSRRPLPL